MSTIHLILKFAFALLTHFKEVVQKFQIVQMKTLKFASEIYCPLFLTKISLPQLLCTSHSAYVVTGTESVRVKIDGLLPPNFLYIPKM